MYSVFFRIFVTTFGLILSVFIFLLTFSSIIMGPPPLDEQPIHGLFIELLEDQLKTASREDAEVFLRNAGTEYGFEYIILEKDNILLPPGVEGDFYATSDFVKFPNSFETFVYFPLFEGESFVRLGPIETFGGPPSKRLPYVFTVIVVIVGIGALLLARPMSNNIRLFEEATRKLANGDMSARARNIRGPVVELAKRFNRMADVLQDTFQSQKHLLQAVSHELRTPVARIHFELEMMAIDKGEAEQSARRQAITEHLDELEKLLDELLTFVRMDGEGEMDKLVHYKPHDYVGKVDKARLYADDVALEVHWNVPQELEVAVDETLFDRAIDNLLRNAMRYASSEVVLEGVVKEDSLIVRVSDDGPGIPEADRETVFKPFSRLDKSRNKASGGVGLGLAIVQRIVSRHGGEVTLSHSQKGGACFETSWPI